MFNSDCGFVVGGGGRLLRGATSCQTGRVRTRTIPVTMTTESTVPWEQVGRLYMCTLKFNKFNMRHLFSIEGLKLKCGLSLRILKV